MNYFIFQILFRTSMTMERKRKKKGGANKKDGANKKEAAAISNKIKRETKTELPQNDNIGMYNINLFF